MKPVWMRLSRLLADQHYWTGATVAGLLSAMATAVWTLLVATQRDVLAVYPNYALLHEWVPVHVAVIVTGTAALWQLGRFLFPTTDQVILDYISRSCIALLWTYIVLGAMVTMSPLPPSLLSASLTICWAAWCAFLARPRRWTS